MQKTVHEQCVCMCLGIYVGMCVFVDVLVSALSSLRTSQIISQDCVPSV